ncbi:MAG: carboxylating nicotinate-nucleotide diphosphorylase [Bacillota bacterium]|nr:carboxylating nicotinate-nucleotide diphosphorylase [Bacillota bacterium]
MIPSYLVSEILKRAFREDIGAGDLTTLYTVPEEKRGSGRVIAREAGLLAGTDIATAAFNYLDCSVKCQPRINDGERFEPGMIIMDVTGPLQPILSAERIALNFLQRLSGIATQTAMWVEELSGFPASLADTRKTTPGLRILEKYAVRVGGAANHRLALDGGILIKDNHITAAGSIRSAVKKVREQAPFTLKIEIEVSNLDQLQEALEAKADIIMLDNMSTELMKKAVQIASGKALLEASGNVTFERLKEIAATGVDYISSGALTHSCRALDISFILEPTE